MKNLQSVLRAYLSQALHFFWHTTPKLRFLRIGILLGVLVFVGINFSRNNEPAPIANTPLPTVFVGTTASITSHKSTSFVGIVRAIDEVQIQSEVGGRVTSVRANAGDTVTAGTIIATLENASQEAALLQAQGSYEAALASAAQSEVGVSDAENTLLVAQNNAINVYRTAYTTVSSIVFTDIDIFFSDPNSVILPGVRINSFGNSDYLNVTRKSLKQVFTDWKNSLSTITPQSNLDMALSDARTHTQTVISMTDTLISAVNRAEKNDTLEGKLLSEYIGDLNTARATLNGMLSAIASAETTLISASENLERARLGGDGSATYSLANAQVKQALGVLRSAQANYEKTVFRSPITGVVNSLSVKNGDFISALSPIAEIANNDALHISIFVSERDLPRFAVGGMVDIEGGTEGSIISIAPALDPTTQKIEVVVASESTELINGNTVTVTPRDTDSTQTTHRGGPVRVPITAIKFNASEGSILIVENGVLVAKPVTLGLIQGSYVTIEEGVSHETVFVLDARGRNAGEHVEAIQK